MRRLFGGAATADIPMTLLDASDMREIPDNQEVFVGNMLEYEVSVIVELLEIVKRNTLTESLLVHIEEAHRLSGTPEEEREQPLELLNMKFDNRDFAERIEIVKRTDDSITSLSFGLISLPEYDTDVLITCTMTPRSMKPQPDELDTQRQITRGTAKSFRIIDPSLFKKEE